MNIATDIKNDMKKLAQPEKAEFLPHFFKTGIGEYGEGDKFLGVIVPNVRMVVKKYWTKADKNDITMLLNSEWHEYRLVALLILVEKFGRGDDKKRSEIAKFYLKNTRFINNWDLVDLSCYKIIGRFLYDNPSEQKTFDKLIDSTLLWDRRVAVVSTFYFLQNGDPSMTLYVVRKLLNDNHDLIQKANGWMLRELGKRVDDDLLLEFIETYYDKIPRTTLRYAIEKFSSDKRARLLKGDFS